MSDLPNDLIGIGLEATHRNGRDLDGIEWLPDANLSCTNCFDPRLSLEDVDLVQEVIMTSEYFCKDTASLSIAVIKQDIPLPALNTPADFCPEDGELNPLNFISGQNLSWYNSQNDNSGESTPPPMPLNQSGTFNHWVSQTLSGCEGPKSPGGLPRPTIPASTSAMPGAETFQGEGREGV